MREATTMLAYEEDARRLRCTRHAAARGLGFERWSAVEGDTANKHVSVGSAEGPGGAGGLTRFGGYAGSRAKIGCGKGRTQPRAPVCPRKAAVAVSCAARRELEPGAAILRILHAPRPGASHRAGHRLRSCSSGGTSSDGITGPATVRAARALAGAAGEIEDDYSDASGCARTHARRFAL